MNENLLVTFSSLFWGQNKCWFNLQTMKTIWSPLTTEIFHKHLTGKIDLGVYCTNDMNECYWGCIDLDDKDNDFYLYQAAREIKREYERAGIQAHVERSRSKGYHVWIFPESPTPARIMRQAQEVILERVGISGVEINPKQISLWKTPSPKTAPNSRSFGIGNLVRIPYAWNRSSNRMCFLSPNGDPLDWPRWAADTTSHRARGVALVELAAQHRDTQTPHVPSQPGPHAAGGKGGANQEAYDIWQGEREIAPGERDNQFFTLAKLMHGNGVDYSNAYDMFVRIYKQKVLDKTGFSMDDALAKLERVYK